MLPALVISQAVGHSTESKGFDDLVEVGLWPAGCQLFAFQVTLHVPGPRSRSRSTFPFPFPFPLHVLVPRSMRVPNVRLRRYLYRLQMSSSDHYVSARFLRFYPFRKFAVGIRDK